MTVNYASFLMSAPVHRLGAGFRRPKADGRVNHFARPSTWYSPCLMGLFWLLLGLPQSTQAQNFVWAKGMGGTSNDEGSSVAVDGLGNVYTTGSFNGTADFDPGPGVVNLTSAGESDIFVSKLDANGNFVWAKRMGGSDVDAGTSVAVDGLGNVYTTGLFNGTADFDPGQQVTNLISAGGSNMFLCKLDEVGNFVWAKGMGGTSGDAGTSVAVDGSGNVYTTGSFNGTADFDPGPGVVNLTSAGGSDIFVSKLDTDGNFVWAKRMGGSDVDAGTSVAVDGSDNVYTTGSFNGTADFDPGPGVVNLTSTGESNVFVSKLDADGNFVWAKGMGGTNADASASVAVDGLGNVYTTGYFVDTADFDPGEQVTNLISAGGSNMFLCKLDEVGNFVWAKGMGGTSGDAGTSVAVDGSGNVYTTGSFNGTADFDPGPGVVNLTSAGESDIFVSKLDANGNFVWAKRMGGSDVDAGTSVAVDGLGNVYTTGLFNGTADFDPGQQVTNLTSEDGGNIFVSKLSPLQLRTSASTNPVCAGTTTALSVTASVGTASYSYTWAAPAGITLSATSTSVVSASIGMGLSGVQTFTVTVAPSDASPSITTLVSVTVNAAPIASISPAALTVCEGAIVSLTASGGSVYQWNSGQTTAIISVTSTGTYSVSVSGTTGPVGQTGVSGGQVVAVEGCFATASTTVTVNPAPSVSITPSSTTLTNASPPVSLTAVGSGTYLWSNGATTQVISATASGTYSVTLTNASGCKASASVPVIGSDLTINLDLPQANFASSGSIENFVVNIFELAGLPTSSGNIRITITAPVGYTLAFDMGLTSINVSGGEHNPVTVNNAQWMVSQSVANRQLSLTMNSGAFISGGGASSLGFSITRTVANSGSVGNITVNVADDLTVGYDSNLINNVYARVISGL
ncbi:hypothetical protein EXU85_16685 [Spirosoma sp. KCTC 42546]|uniref:SBBP repeat-containing protein n=1 Tax=Spirosoma sp. KCTC 42546 TaxID=2520506 RepID=UPI001158BF8D|nr:SBBP repeat-containing protein [Spirosoma sp. KCTC 42546]QDK80150.1 hypothetical protein EXU85_16685 [Spirosoma sp. KCTC 42546]